MNTDKLRELALAAKGHTRGSYVLASFAAKANPTAILELLDALKEIGALPDKWLDELQPDWLDCVHELQAILAGV